MKNISFIFLFFITAIIETAHGQNFEDSSRSIIYQEKGDTTQVNAYIYLANYQPKVDAAINYAQKGLLLAQKLKYKKGEAQCLFLISNLYYNINVGESINYAIRVLNVYKEIRDYDGACTVSLSLESTYRDDVGDYRESLNYAFLGEQIAVSKKVTNTAFFPGHRAAPLFAAEIANTYLLMDQLDSALVYINKAIVQNELFNGTKWNFPYYLLAKVQYMQGKYKQSLENFRLAIPLAKGNELQHQHDTLQIYSGMSTLFRKIGIIDSTIYYGQMVVQSHNPDQEKKHLLEALTNLGDAYKIRGEKDSAIKYIELSHALKDSMFNIQKDREVQNISFTQSLREKEIVADQLKLKSKVQLYSFLAGIIGLVLVAGILWRNKGREQKAKNKIELAYTELKSTQSQMIQREKLASLGELTAGIAHEIQNPLNFVNNFSDVNRELADELAQEIDKGNYGDAKEIAKDIKHNEEKINHHGKRADTIVKGMLQHSRTSSGQKEPTDINALADEYLRLAYHGLRAKDKSFNATIKTDFDESIGNVNIIPQDIGRVVLNLINNAFYAVDEKKKQNQNGYEPIVSVSTKKNNGKVEISIKDNGNGIQQKVLDKIFQPFFTTKPTGQGTGLGLSLSYEIVKAHGGDIKVITAENEGTEFIIQL